MGKLIYFLILVAVAMDMAEEINPIKETFFVENYYNKEKLLSQEYLQPTFFF